MIHTPCRKNVPPLDCYNFETWEWILIFGEWILIFLAEMLLIE